jgi:hypothetical protein
VFDITQWEHLLNAGTNVLAIHGLNRALDSGDMLLVPELVGGVLDTTPGALPIYYTFDGTDPRGPDGSVAGTQFTGPVSLGATQTVAARALIDGTWSALVEALFVVETPLRVTEIMYHPADPTASEILAGFTDQDDFEFIELQNIGSQTIDLAGVRFTEGIEFDFTGSGVTALAPGEYVVVVANLAAFGARYDTAGMHVAGEFAAGKNLSNAGEDVQLIDAGDGTIQSFAYEDDDWYPSTDGPGFSLVIVDPSAELAQWNLQSGWRPSFGFGGSPGGPDMLAADLDGDRAVTLVDLAILQSNYGISVGATREMGDLTGDGSITRADAARLLRSLGQTAPAPSIAAATAAPSAAPPDSNGGSTIQAIDAGFGAYSDSRDDSNVPGRLQSTRARRIAGVRTAGPHDAVRFATPSPVPQAHRTLLAARRADRAVRLLGAIPSEIDGPNS